MLARLVCSSLLVAACAAEERIEATADQELTLHRHDEVSEPSRLKFDLFSGARFGGIIGGAIVSSLRYETHHAVRPEAQAQVGVSGTKLTLGPRLGLRENHWTLNANGLNLNGDSETALALRGVACYRWTDRDRAPSIWHGIVGREGWYFGGEISVIANDLVFDVDVTWRQDDPKRPQYTLAYGIDF